MKSCNFCTCAVSPQSERGSEFSSVHSCETIYCTVCSCISSPHCGSSCDWKGCSCLRIYSDTSHKISVRTSLIVKSTLSWWPLITEINLIGTNLIIVLWLGSLFLPTSMSRNLYFSCCLVDGSIQYFDFKFVVEDVNLVIFIWPKLISFCPIHGTGVGKADESSFIILNCQ